MRGSSRPRPTTRSHAIALSDPPTLPARLPASTPPHPQALLVQGCTSHSHPLCCHLYIAIYGCLYHPLLIGIATWTKLQHHICMRHIAQHSHLERSDTSPAGEDAAKGIRNLQWERSSSPDLTKLTPVSTRQYRHRRLIFNGATRQSH